MLNVIILGVQECAICAAQVSVASKWSTFH